MKLNSILVNESQTQVIPETQELDNIPVIPETQIYVIFIEVTLTTILLMI